MNQGDSLDHDFSAMYACLLFPPAKLIHNNMAEVGQIQGILRGESGNQIWLDHSV